MINKIRKAVSDPGLAWYRVQAEFNGDKLRERYQRLALEQGFRRALFVLSFDCDTDLDIEVAQTVHKRLMANGIKPIYAVPGELLHRGASTYRAIADTGAEFINHGYREHTVLNGQNEYVSTVFYGQMNSAEIEEDIRKGHEAVLMVTGRAPTGFRAPHFGTFSGRRQLDRIHRVLGSLNYRFSSSSMPLDGFRRGPAAFILDRIRELPVTGCYDQPFRVLDSWGFRSAPGRRASEWDYVEQFRKVARYFNSRGQVGLVNLYADPSQVHDWPQFFECITALKGIAVSSYEEVLEEIDQ